MKLKRRIAVQINIKFEQDSDVFMPIAVLLFILTLVLMVCVTQYNLSVNRVEETRHQMEIRAMDWNERHAPQAIQLVPAPEVKK